MDLFPFQKIGAHFLQTRKYALLADEQGLGKTCQAIVAADTQKIERVLIVCPASVKYNWRREIKQWTDLPAVVINSVYDIYPLATYLIINYDLIHRAKFAKELLKMRFGLIICDEAHYLKNSRAKRTKIMYGKNGLVDRADRVWLMTGTPVMNRPVEIFPMLRRFMPGQLGKYADYMNFTKKYCSGYMGKFGWDATGASNVDELAKILGLFMLRRTKKEVMPELPEKIFQKIEFDCPSKAVEKLVIKEKEAFDQNNLLGGLSSDRREIGIQKLPMVIAHLKDLLEEKDKVIVFAHHREVLEKLNDALAEFFPVLVYGGLTALQKQICVDKFVHHARNRVFLGQIDSAGIGIDGLQKVADTVVFAEISWVPGAIKQAIDRCHRIGQVNKVLVQFLTMKGGIDEQIFDSVAGKTKVIKKLTEQKERAVTMKTIEQNLERIADALEVVAKAVATNANAPVKETAAPVEDVDPTFDDAPKPKKEPKAKPAGMKTAKELLAYCNKVIIAMPDKTKAKEVVGKVTAEVKEKLGAATLGAIPADKLDQAKGIFDAIVAAE